MVEGPLVLAPIKGAVKKVRYDKQTWNLHSWREDILETWPLGWAWRVDMAFGLFFIFWPRCAARGILVPRPGIEPAPLALKAWSLNHRLLRKSLRWVFATVCTCSVSQLCLTLFNPMGCSPPGASVLEPPSKNTGVGCHFLFQGNPPT